MVKTPLEELIPNASPDAIDLLEKMFIYDPNERPTATQCLDHDFFLGFEAPIQIKKGVVMSSTKPMSNKNNKLLNSKLMRLNSKKFDHERISSPFISKTSDYDKGSSGKNIGYSKLNKMAPMKSEIGSGFYTKHKPIKSPGTPTSSTNSSAMYKENKLKSK
jgi:serine/threonine protein kinase